MKKYLLFTFFLGFLGCGKLKICFSNEISPYIEFLDTQNTTSKDYILEVFENKDIVVLCERLHPEFTQYEMLLEIIKDSRFRKSIGNIFIENCGRQQESNIQHYLNDQLAEEKADKLLLEICRNNSLHPTWDYYNFYYFFKELREINKTLSNKEKIQVYPTDLEVVWKNMDKEKYKKEVQAKFDDRDKLMAEYIIRKFNKILSSSQDRKKALVIMNYRHAFAHKFRYPNNSVTNNVGRFLMERYKTRFANVLVNSFAIIESRSDTDFDIAPFQDGKWDAAFGVAGKDNLGFSLGGNVFGRSHFDYWNFTPHHYSYEDVFDGFVYYKQICSQKLIFGIPNFIDSVFLSEVKRRNKIIGDLKEDSIIWKMNKRNDKMYLFCTDSLKYQINKWLTK